MPCTATSSYLTLLPYYYNESKVNIHDQFIDSLKSYDGSSPKIWKIFMWTVPNFTKSDILAGLKETRDSHETFNFNCIHI